MKRLFSRFVNDESGATAIEYGLLAGFISVAIAGILTGVRDRLVAALTGGFLTLGILAFRVTPLPVTLINIPWIARLHSITTGIPYGVAISVGALVILPETAWMTGVN
jgi:Flp pilus assembly pilin Flp